MRYKARFCPQAWVNNYAIDVDPEGETEWDVTDYFLSDNYTDDERAEMLERGYSYDTDSLRDDPISPAWVKEWDGPFEVVVSEGLVEPLKTLTTVLRNLKQGIKNA